MSSRSHDAAMVDIFRKSPSYVNSLLLEVLRDSDTAELRILLRQLDAAFGRPKNESFGLYLGFEGHSINGITHGIRIGNFRFS